MEENKQQFNLSDFGVSDDELKKQQEQFSLSDFGITEEEAKAIEPEPVVEPSVYDRFVDGLLGGVVSPAIKHITNQTEGINMYLGSETLKDIDNALINKANEYATAAKESERLYKESQATKVDTSVEDANELNTMVRQEYDEYIKDAKKLPSNTPEQRNLRLMKIANLQLEMKQKLTTVPITTLGEASGYNEVNMAGKIGEATPDIALSIATRNKSNTAQAIAEGALTLAKTGSVVEAGENALLTYVFGKAVSKMIPSVAKDVDTKFGKKVKELPEDERKSLEAALNKMDEFGIDRADEKARALVIDKLDLSKPTTEVSKDVISELTTARGKARDFKNSLYEQAKEVGKQTQSVDIVSSMKRATLDDNGVPIAAKDLTENQSKSMLDIGKIINRRTTGNATDMEVTLKELKKSRESAGDASYMYDSVIKDIEDKQFTLLDSIGKPEAFKEARQADIDYKALFFGKGKEKEGLTSGKAIKSVLEAQDNYDVSAKVLSQGINPDIANKLVNHITPEVRKDMVMDILSKGINKNALDTPEGVSALMSNYSKMDNNGLILMLGEVKAKELKDTMSALGVIQETIKTSGKFDKDISQDLLNLGAAAAAIKISPYASVHVAINSAKSIAHKGLLKKQKLDLIKRVQTKYKGEEARTMLKALARIPISEDDMIEEVE